MHRRTVWLPAGVLLFTIVGVCIYLVTKPPDMPPIREGMTFNEVTSLAWGSVSYLLPVDSDDSHDHYNFCTTEPDQLGRFWVVTVYFNSTGRVSRWDQRQESSSWLVWIDATFFKTSTK